jgi:integrase/recombinase XerD
VSHLEQLRAWFAGQSYDMEPADANAYFGTVLRDAARRTQLACSQELTTYFLFLDPAQGGDPPEVGRVA